MAFWMGSGPCLFEGVVSASDVLVSPCLFLSPLVACSLFTSRVDCYSG
uniref:Uncharacterized protein n=1 Tax=Anguilla anguilla TaxID=7936 RepID=A0A0E9QQB6_ANGAN